MSVSWTGACEACTSGLLERGCEVESCAAYPVTNLDGPPNDLGQRDQTILNAKLQAIRQVPLDAVI